MSLRWSLVEIHARIAGSPLASPSASLHLVLPCGSEELHDLSFGHLSQFLNKGIPNFTNKDRKQTSSRGLFRCYRANSGGAKRLKDAHTVLELVRARSPESEPHTLSDDITALLSLLRKSEAERPSTPKRNQRIANSTPPRSLSPALRIAREIGLLKTIRAGLVVRYARRLVDTRSAGDQPRSQSRPSCLPGRPPQ